MINIATLITCHNRREKTLNCLNALAVAAPCFASGQGITLMDDGSTDATREAVLSSFPQVDILIGSGSLFWCGGMRTAWTHAAKKNPDYYLLLNDDTLLYPEAIHSLLETCGGSDQRRIGVGAIKDPTTGEATYGCWNRESGLIKPNGSNQSCDTFNANAVLIPRCVYEEMGIFHDRYTHGMGDFDYGYQARKRGIEVIMSSNFIGECPRNSSKGTWRDCSLPRLERIRKLQSPKGLPFREWVIYNRRTSGFKWPWKSITPLLRILLGK